MNILLTGGSRGLGLVVARQQVELGNTVYVVNRSTSSELNELIRQHGDRVVFTECDLAKPSTIKESVFERLIGNEVPIHGFVSNAAIAYDNLVSNLDLDLVETMFQVNVLSPLALTKLVIRNMLLHQIAGSMVYVSSICCHKGYKGLAMYAATKGAVEAFSINVSREWGSKGIRSNCVVPGFMETSMSSKLQNADREKIFSRAALKEPTSIASVASTIGFLLSDASCSVTGQNFVVDAGTI